MEMIENKYKKYYFLLMEKAKTRPLEALKNQVRVEKHHIIPSSLGGTDLEENLVTLTVKEHLIAHHLLTKFLSSVEKAKMCHAYFYMTQGIQGKFVKLTERQQQTLMKEYSIARKIMRTGKKHSEETKKKISDSNLGKKVSQEVREKISKANSGRLVGIKRSEEFCQKVSNGLKGKKKTKEHVEKINKNPEKIKKTAETHRGMKRSEESKQKMREAALKRIERQGGPWNKGMKKIDGKFTHQTDLENFMD